jgi:hypothetical protein
MADAQYAEQGSGRVADYPAPAADQLLIRVCSAEHPRGTVPRSLPQ